MTDAPNRHDGSPAQPPVRDSGPVERVRGNQEVPPDGTGVSGEGGDVDVAAVQADRDELFGRLQRLAAEFDNYRKRSARENAALAQRANERLVKDLIPILDDLGRALEAAGEHEEAKLEEGVRLTHRALADLLQKEGLAEIEADGKFDPHVHEALLSQPSDEEEGSVIEVVQKGYKLGDRVLRPARVVVAAPPVHEG